MSKSLLVCEHPVSNAAFSTSMPLHGRERDPSSRETRNLVSNALGTVIASISHVTLLGFC